VNRTPWPESLVEAICQEIKIRRTELGLTIYALSQESGVSQQALANYEKGVRRPNLECLVRAAKGLRLEVSELIARAERLTAR
jgi:transcriptional regulator with XRE-family HTH domain